MQRPLAVHAQHLGVLEAMLAAAAGAEELITGPLSPSQLLEGETLTRFSEDFEMGSRRGRVINSTVLRRNMESLMQFPACTVLADREQLPQLLSPLQGLLTLHFSRSSCDPGWLAQV